MNTYLIVVVTMVEIIDIIYSLGEISTIIMYVVRFWQHVLQNHYSYSIMHVPHDNIRLYDVELNPCGVELSFKELTATAYHHFCPITKALQRKHNLVRCPEEWLYSIWGSA